MAKAELKTKAAKASADAFISKIADKQTRADCQAIAHMMRQVTGEEPVMWGPSIIGFGSWHYKYDSGHEGDTCMLGFSPRKQNITLYIVLCFDGFKDDLKKLGKHSCGKSCLYIKRLADVDQRVLKDLMKKSLAQLKEIAKAPTTQEGVRAVKKKSAKKSARKAKKK